MKYLKTYEGFKSGDILIIVDIQKSFKKFFTDNYVNAVKAYCKRFDRVYQIWDNHIDGKNVDKDYLYDRDPDVVNHSDLWTFPNQKELIEKRYNYDVDADFYKKILSPEVYNEVKSKEDAGQLKRGDMFSTKEGTIIVYIGNNHRWYHCPKKLYDLFKELKEAQTEDTVPIEVTIIGGADNECLLDIETAAKAMGVVITRDEDYIYSATHCPIK